MSETQHVVGIHSVRASLDGDPDAAQVLYLRSGGNQRLRELERIGRRIGVTIESLSRPELDEIANGAAHQGAILKTRAARVVGLGDLLASLADRDRPALVLVLDGVTDPRNLGACVRSAAAMGADAVVTPARRSAPMTGTAQKAASGGASVVPVIPVSNLARSFTQMQAAGLWIIGLEAGAAPIGGVDLSSPVAIVLGAEGDGLRELSRRHCDHVAGIPFSRDAGRAVSSLNVSVAAGIALYEVVRQRG